VGGGGGVSRFDYDDVSGGFATMATIGYDVPNQPFFVDVSYVSSGKADVDDSDADGLYDASIKFSGVQFMAGYAFRSQTGSSLYLKLGGYSTKTTGEGDVVYWDGASYVTGPFTLTEKTTGFSYSFGGEWRVNPHFGLRAELDGFSKIDDFAENKTANLVMGLAVFHF